MVVLSLGLSLCGGPAPYFGKLPFEAMQDSVHCQQHAMSTA